MNTKKRKLIISLATYAVVTAVFIILTVMINNKTISRTLKGMLIPICSWIVMAVSLNLVVGISGELSLGHAGFMSIGAFSGIIVSGWLLNGFQLEDPTLRLIIALVAGGIVAGIAGALIGIPVLRLRGDYLAIVTLAFGEINKNVMNCVYVTVEGTGLHWGFLDANMPGTLMLNGPMGAVGVTKISTFTAGFILVMFTLFVVLNLSNSRSGRAIMAARDNRIAAEATGINITKYKMMAFVTAAALAGMAGALYGLSMATLLPTKFSFNESINVLVFVVLGGIGNIPGSVVSAAALTILPERLRFLQNYRMLAYAVLLIVVMLLSNNPMLKTLLRKLVSGRKNKQDEEEMRA